MKYSYYDKENKFHVMFNIHTFKKLTYVLNLALYKRIMEEYNRYEFVLSVDRIGIKGCEEYKEDYFMTNFYKMFHIKVKRRNK